MIPLVFSLVQNTEDQEFLIAVFERYKRLMFSIARKYTNTPEDSEEILQSSLEKMVRHVTTLRTLDESKLAAYIGMLTKNTAINYVKHQSLVNKYAAQLDDEYDCQSSQWFESPEDIVIMMEKREYLQAALSRLSPVDQTLIEGKLYLGLTDAELGAILGCKPRSISMMMTRAKRRAMQEIKRVLNDDES